jgi:hypothetical protein
VSRSYAVLIAIALARVAAARPPAKPLDVSKLRLDQRAGSPELCSVGSDDESRDECAQQCEAGKLLSCARLGAWYAGGGESGWINTAKRDLDKAAAAFEKACNGHYAQACYALHLTDIARHAKAPRGDLAALCKGGYALACGSLAESEHDPKRHDQLLAQACHGGDRDACLGLISDDDLTAASGLVATMVTGGATVSAQVKLACPKGTVAYRSIQVYPSALGTVRPKWLCGAIDPATHRFVANGPYIEYATEEDEAVYPHGVIAERGVYKHGKRDGVVEAYDAGGYLTSSTTYREGEEDGVQYNLSWEAHHVDEVERVMWKRGHRGASVTGPAR